MPSLARKDWRAARRAVALALRPGEAPWRTRAIPIMTEEHERWVRLHPATAEEIIEYVQLVARSLPLLFQHGIKVDVLLVSTASDMSEMMEGIRKWAEDTAYKLEPHVKAGVKGMAVPYADLHVVTYAVDRWLEGNA